jgi:RimJ/RimL family protein N-acetyltransferase
MPTADSPCYPDGLHVTESPRLWIVSGRESDLDSFTEFASEPQAQRWLGWRREHLRPTRVGPTAKPLDHPYGIFQPGLGFLFFAAVNRQNMHVIAGFSIDASTPAGHTVGGVVHHDYRHQGYGREALREVCTLAHRHFGIAQLHAVCESTNAASQRWLASCGFVAAEGPAIHTLPNGRLIDSLWWRRTDPHPVRCCPWLKPDRATASAIGLSNTALACGQPRRFSGLPDRRRFSPTKLYGYLRRRTVGP